MGPFIVYLVVFFAAAAWLIVTVHRTMIAEEARQVALESQAPEPVAAHPSHEQAA